MITRRRLLLGAVAAPTVIRRKARADEPMYVLAWGGYTDQPLLDRFTAQTGIGLVVDNITSYDEIFMRLRSSYGPQYSVVIPHFGLTRDLQQQGLIQPIDTAQLANFSAIDPHFVLETETVLAGQKYAIPTLFGTCPCIYNTEKLPEPPTSWADLDTDNLTGHVGMLDDPFSNYNLAGRTIGSTDMPLMTISQFDDATELLTNLKSDRVAHFTASPVDLVNRLRQGRITISTTGYESMILFQEAAGKLAVARMSEGDFAFVQAFSISASAPNVAGAHQFINFMLDPGEQAGLANRTQRGIVNLAAVPLIDPVVAALTNYADLDAVFAQSPITGFPPLNTTARAGATWTDWIVAWDSIRLTTSKAAS
jgi:spermidine/putrescine transport system substrate-binding protein